MLAQYRPYRMYMTYSARLWPGGPAGDHPALGRNVVEPSWSLNVTLPETNKLPLRNGWLEY